MEGLTASELTMIRRLAGNDPVVRKKTIKKLKQWLSAILRRVPDTPQCRDLIENNFLRVWKALFYTMWMSDKPLPQEQLAEQIVSLTDIFSSKPHVMLLWSEWFFRTMAREWQMIDRFRMDKFMMLVRRFLRKSLMVVSEKQWKVEVLEGFLRIISSYIFNRHAEVKKTRSKARDASPERSPLGLQIHIVDIFLEELAKVGGESLKNKKILKILGPFIYELCNNDDDRLLQEIRERVFCHLMRQSDVGIDYSEGVLGDINEDDEDGEGFDDEDDDEDAVVPRPKQKKSKKKNDRNGDSNIDENGEDEEGEMDMNSVQPGPGPFDPRAGAVDVILPQLDIDYKELANKLIESGGAKTVKMKNRKLMYNLARQFQKLTSGEYPLAIDVEDTRKPAIAKKEVDKATERLLNFEEAAANPDRKNRKPKKIRKKLAQQKEKERELLENSLDSSVDAGDSSIYLQDSELLDHVSDNYMSYLEELHQQNTEDGGNEGDEGDNDDDNEDEDDEDNDEVETTLECDNEIEHQDFNLSGDEDEVEVTANVKKNKKKAKKNQGGRDTLDSKSLNNSNGNNSLIKSKNKKKKNSASDATDITVDGDEDNVLLTNGNQENHSTKSTNLSLASASPSSSILRGKNRKSNGNNNASFNNGLTTTTPDKSNNSANGETNTTNGSTSTQDGEEFITIPSSNNNNTTPNRPKKRKLSESFDSVATPNPKMNKTPAAPSSSLTSSNKRKRVTIVLARNLHHEHSDYKDSIQRSPSIPFSPHTAPKYGLLKSPKTPSSATASPLHRALAFTPRRASGKF